jgi:hypothetical protein
MKYFSLILFGVWVLVEMLSARGASVAVTKEEFSERLVGAALFRTTQKV